MHRQMLMQIDVTRKLLSAEFTQMLADIGGAGLTDKTGKIIG